MESDFQQMARRPVGCSDVISIERRRLRLDLITIEGDTTGLHVKQSVFDQKFSLGLGGGEYRVVFEESSSGSADVVPRRLE